MIEPAYRYRATARRVIDGDTFVADVDLGFFAGIAVHVRVRGVDTPELGTPEGRVALGWAVHLLTPDAAPRPGLVLESFHDRRSFERWVCDVYLAETGESVAELAIRDAGGRRIA
jgi:endonuclease YncB( thermonuclease family)